ncbi:MAG: DNA-3-methyladenine glycosylase family protein [Saccharofermentanales bacterium]
MEPMLKTDESILLALLEREPLFGNIIEVCGPIEMPLSEDPFTALASAIVSQQLSGRVAEVIWGRVVALLGGDATPEGVLAVPDEIFRKAGLSNAKTKYLKCLAEAVLGGVVRPGEFQDMDDEAIIRSLVAVKGIGRWTAEMFLMFSLGRPDVFSAGDGGLQRAVKKLYGLDGIPSADELIAISSRWKPYRTFASFYLWRSLSVKPPNF